MGLGSLLKIVTGGISTQEQIGALLDAAGLKMNYCRLEGDQIAVAFKAASVAAVSPSAQVAKFWGQHKDGDMILSLMITIPASRVPAVVDTKKVLTIAEKGL